MIPLVFLFEILVNVASATKLPQRHVISIQEGSGRVVEAYNADFIIGLRKDARQRYGDQVEEDRENDEFTPNPNSTWTENTPIGLITLASQIHSGYTSSVYEVIGHPGLLIKYQAHCVGMNKELHPLLNDAWYGDEAHALGIGPRIFSVSPPSLLCDDKKGKCLFEISDENFSSCKGKQGTLRYLIMERVSGMELHHYRSSTSTSVEGALPFESSLIIGYHLISLIQKLHTEGKTVHGDIHSPNVFIAFTNRSTGSFELKLIDFGHGFKIPDGKYPEEPVLPDGDHVHHLRTQWQIDGYAWSQRDDVMKAIQTIAHIMHPFSYFDMEQSMSKSGYWELREWKQRGNWFLPYPGFDPLAAIGIPEYAKIHIRKLLEKILTLARSMKINQPIRYDGIKELLSQCVNIIRDPSSVNTTITETRSTTTILPLST